VATGIRQRLDKREINGIVINAGAHPKERASLWRTPLIVRLQTPILGILGRNDQGVQGRQMSSMRRARRGKTSMIGDTDGIYAGLQKILRLPAPGTDRSSTATIRLRGCNASMIGVVIRMAFCSGTAVVFVALVAVKMIFCGISRRRSMTARIRSASASARREGD